MRRLRAVVENAALGVLSSDWSGLAIAALAACAGALCGMPRGRGKAARTVLAAAFYAFAVGLAAGAARHLARTARTRATHPPPGRLIDVGGYRMHVLAEGEPNGKPPVVLMPGSHAGGYALYHLHAALRARMRSIVIDRPGSGWSDAGPFPRTTAREADEVIAALDAAGERGPFVFAGHSFGGLLVGNVAKKRPDLVAAVLLLDATPPDTIVYGPRFEALAKSRREFARLALAMSFGWDLTPRQHRHQARDPATAAIVDIIDRRLGAAGEALQAVERSPRALWSAYSIFSELSPAGIAAAAWDLVVYDGDLDGLPVYLIAPGDVESEAGGLPPGRPAEILRMKRILKHSRERYMLSSNRSERVYAPRGTGHNFPFERPDFVLDVIGRVAAAHAAERDEAAAAPGGIEPEAQDNEPAAAD